MIIKVESRATTFLIPLNSISAISENENIDGNKYYILLNNGSDIVISEENFRILESVLTKEEYIK